MGNCETVCNFVIFIIILLKSFILFIWNIQVYSYFHFASQTEHKALVLFYSFMAGKAGYTRIIMQLVTYGLKDQNKLYSCFW